MNNSQLTTDQLPIDQLPIYQLPSDQFPIEQLPNDQLATDHLFVCSHLGIISASLLDLFEIMFGLVWKQFGIILRSVLD